MKILIFFALMAFAAADDDLYDLENVNMTALASNIGEFKKFVDCLISKGPCTELYLSYKVVVPESVKQGCRKCTIELKQIAYQFFDTLKTHLPEEYILFKEIYDPENIYVNAMEIDLIKYKTI